MKLKIIGWYIGNITLLCRYKCEITRVVYFKTSKIEVVVSKISLEALGAEKGKYLSHAVDKVWLQTGVQGLGEIFILEDLKNGRVALACLGGEEGKYLSHAFDKLWLQDGIKGEGEEWICHYHGDGHLSFECLGAEKGKYLSHAKDKMWLQDGYKGEGELWAEKSA